MPQTQKPKRIRRNAEHARTLILDAAERRLVLSGAKGIRLQDVAADVGIGHPAVLHHFGSRERLVAEVMRRRITAMNQDVVAALAGSKPEQASAVALFERLYAAFGPGGNARVAAFMALEGRIAGVEESASLYPLAQVTHASRLGIRKGKGPGPDFEDTYFTVLLSAFALFGEAIIGPLFRGEPEEAPDAGISKRFREWTARLVFAHLSADAAPEPKPGKATSRRRAR
jgi:AcrR family transcriptional regulator